MTLRNRAGMSVTGTPGTGTITLNAALASGQPATQPAWQSFVASGINDGDQVRLLIYDGAAWEISIGTYTAAGTTVTRTLIESSTGSLLSLSSSAQVFIAAIDDDVQLAQAMTHKFYGGL